MANQRQVGALIQLLDDPDDGVFEHVRQQLIALGTEAIPNLEEAWETAPLGLTFQQRVESLIHDIQADALVSDLEHWCASEQNTLLDGALLINRFQYPDFDKQKVLRQIDEIQQAIWLELNANLTAFEQVKVMNHLIFDVFGFSGNTKNYHSAQNSFLSSVLETRKGNPLSLSILYSIIAQNLKLPIYGVNLPKHFVLAYLDRVSLMITGSVQKAEALFYINPFSRGAVFSTGEIDKFLNEQKIDAHPDYYRAATNHEIVKRMVNNLSVSYKHANDAEKLRELERLERALGNHKS